MKTLARGENCPAPSGTLTVTLRTSAAVDVSALLLGAGGKVRSDDDLIFYNQPSGPGVQYHRDPSGHRITVDPERIPAAVETVAITASLDGTGAPTFAASGPVETSVDDSTGTTVVMYPADALGAENALVCLEIYRRGDAWKIRAVGQGFSDGLAGVATAFGITIDDDKSPTADTPSPEPTPSPT
ncbi:TerD family protein, partial [Rhodococcus sp. 14-2470-1b]|uniref:TerD family protein n=1 Tax=Rhodococcus sp. 14-2470-1b TaxID=2023149 RepID=UPI0020CD2EAF